MSPIAVEVPRVVCAMVRRAAWVVACVPLGCFVGNAALGLPCERDGDCGIDLRCVDGFCGGRQDATTGTTTEMSGESSQGESTTSSPMCAVDPPQCIPDIANQPDADCNGDCTLPKCGDGYWNDEAPNNALDDDSTEQCDMGEQGTRIDHPMCDFDCTVPMCGDGHFNAAAPAVEACDDGNDSDLDACTVGCREPVFVERFDAEPPKWTVEPYDLSAYDDLVDPPVWWPIDPGQTDTAGWRWVDGAFDSGGVPYHDSIQNTEYGYAGVTRLVSPPIVLPAAPEDFVMQLRFGHTLDVEPLACKLSASEFGDGGRVWIRVNGEDTLLQPVIADHYVALENDCGGANPPYQRPNPMTARAGEGFSGRMQSQPAEAFDLDAFATRTVQLVFEFGTDCKYCPAVDRESSRWRVDDVVVAAFPAP